MVTEAYLHPRRRRALITWAVTDTALGLVLLLSTPGRLSSHAFDPAKAVAPMHIWGAAAALIGVVWTVVAITGPRLPWPLAGYLIGLPAALLASWHLFFWMSLCFAAATTSTVGFTGCVIYLGVALNHLLFAVDQV